jgi:hypothetical protein
MARKRSKRLPKSFVKLREDVTRIAEAMRDALTKRPSGVTPPSPSQDKWGGLLAKRAPSRADLEKVRSALRKPKGYDQKPLQQLIKQYPNWTYEQLRIGYEEKTKTKVSLDWIKKYAPKYRVR